MIRRPIIVAPLMLWSVFSCNSGDGTDLEARPPAATATSAASGDGDVAHLAADAVEEQPSVTGQGAEAAPNLGTGNVVTVPSSVIVVPETGVPGLDSDDAFCASWSRFGGSFQVIAVNAAFGDGSPESIATLEVIASPTVAGAYDALGDVWPGELDHERSVALDGAFGPFARRLEGAGAALDAVGATDEDVATIEQAWLDALTTRAPDRVEVAIDLSDELRAMIDEAAARHVELAGGWFDDASLVTRADMPRTDAYLATQCPDQGTLSGGDADG